MPNFPLRDRVVDWLPVLYRLWMRTCYFPCDTLTEWRAIQVPQNTTDRLTIVPTPGGRTGNAVRVEVRDGDIAWNPKANGGAGAPIPGGWRAEVVGPEEHESRLPMRHRWSTLFDPSYPLRPVSTQQGDPQIGKEVWQVITQWHQGDNDQGGPPPVAFIIVNDEIRLHVHRPDPTNPANSIEVGQWTVAPGLDRGTWHDLQVEIVWSTSAGSIQVWHNGQPVQLGADTTLSGIPTLFPAQAGSTVPPSAYLKLGLYRKPVTSTAPGPFVLFHDEFTCYSPYALRPIPWPPWFKVRIPLPIPKPPPWPPPWPPFRSRS